METTDMQAIREAIERELGHMQSRHDDSVGALRDQLRERMDNLRNALAILDKIDKSGEGERGTGMVITDSAVNEIAHKFTLYDCGLTTNDGLEEEDELLYQTGYERVSRLLYWMDHNGYLAPAKAPAEVATIEVREALSLGLRVANEIRRTCLPGPINSDVLGAIHTFERAADVILSNTPEHGN